VPPHPPKARLSHSLVYGITSLKTWRDCDPESVKNVIKLKYLRQLEVKWKLWNNLLGEGTYKIIDTHLQIGVTGKSNLFSSQTIHGSLTRGMMVRVTIKEMAGRLVYQQLRFIAFNNQPFT
jgi:hypothetical protein